jgi:hypothetical protein
MSEASEPTGAHGRTPGAEPTPTEELRLEPVQFIARTDAVMRLGALMLGAGASSARVRDSMERAAHAVGIDTLHTRVGMTDIVVTTSRGQMFRTRVTEIHRPHRRRGGGPRRRPRCRSLPRCSATDCAPRG